MMLLDDVNEEVAQLETVGTHSVRDIEEDVAHAQQRGTIAVSEHVSREPENEPQWIAQATQRIEKLNYLRTQLRFTRFTPHVHRNDNGSYYLVTFTDGGRKLNICVACFNQHGVFVVASQACGLLCPRHIDYKISQPQLLLLLLLLLLLIFSTLFFS